MNTARWIVFCAMVLAQLAVPFMMIAGRERVMEGGTAYKFRCGPVDPYDAFRGRYVALSFPDMRLDGWGGEYLDGSERVFATLGVAEDGFARIEALSMIRPESGDYLEVTATGGGAPDASVRVYLPFNRYYMDEFQAPEAEIAYREQSRTEEGAHILVYVKDGEGVIEGLYFGDLSVEEFLTQPVPADQPTPTEVPVP